MFNTGGFNGLTLNSGSSVDGNVIDLSAHLSGQGQMYSRRKEVIGADTGNAFNLMAFNTPDSSVSIEYILDFNLDMTAGVELSGEGRAQSDFVRSYDLETVPMSGDGRISNADYVREILMGAVPMSGEGRLQPAEASRFHTDFIEFTDVFRPGEVIVIDSGKFKITRNGQNVSHLYNGDFFDLNLGNNNLTWTDPETGRTVLFRITHRDKFLY
ncbi:phage tail family protein [Paenibacillus polymyxa]|uniref:phage tail family protein n=1 Tax=Paenibacillus polymyxa TaxID=1406 RepID=UPI001C9DD8C8|nr:phage tail family protein [Paenibacillus polymyxa]MBY7736273.1 phage tail family protein [Paenibacillus polymyxa]UMR33667.1 phage tail family protein [Paenibacillus polymyxa]